MTDDKKKKGWQDRARIDPHDESEVRYAAKALKTTVKKILKAIESGGDSREAVTEYIKKKKKEKKARKAAKKAAKK